MMLNQRGVSGVPNEIAMRSLRRGSEKVWVAGHGPYRQPVPVQVMRPGHLHGFGMGQAAASATTTVTDSFFGGLSIWSSPTVAIQAISPALTNFSTFPLTALGVLAPPALLAVALFSMGGKRR